VPKRLLVRPEEVRKPGALDLGSIPVNQYGKSLAQEVESGTGITPGRAKRIYRDMVVIRTFETMLDQIKKLGAFEGVEYQHAGPAHLSIGQEAAAVGQCVHLRVGDHLFGSHRSHGEIIAKGLRAVEDLAGNGLESIMETYFDGAILDVVDQPFESANGVAALSYQNAEESRGIDFLLYGLLAEVFARETGFNKGMGGSMHAFFMPFGVYPNNAIVGGSADIAAGSALYKKVRRAGGISVANIGDASIGCGPVWEAMGFASMGQFNTLWEEAYRGGLPIVFNFMNNFYGMGGQPIGETMGFERLARAGAAINPDNMHAECVDGNNPLAVADAYGRLVPMLEKGEAPALLEVLCYRQSGHSPSDQSSYREREEIESWQAVDPITEFGRALTEAGISDAAELERVQAYATEAVRRACVRATDMDLSPRMPLQSGAELEALEFSNDADGALPGLDSPDDVLMPLADNARVKQIAKKSRRGIDADSGNPLKEMRAVSVRDGLFEAIAHHFYNDSRLIAYGEENRDWGGAFGVYRGLTEALPYHRLFNSPISEGAIVGTAAGYALEGGRALVELMYCDFMGRAGDEIFNQLAKWQAMSGGYCQMPVVLRVSVGSKYGAQHSQDWTALCAHVPGLKVVFPATPHGAKGLMASALSGSDPVVFFESQRIYDMTERFAPEGVPAEYYTVPFGQANLVKQGSDLTILTFGATLYRAVEAAAQFETQYGISVEIIDGQCLVPFDLECLYQSVRKTGKLLLASDACERGSYLHTIASQITQVAFDELDAPPCIIGAVDSIVPPAELESFYYPQPEWFLDAYHTQIAPLPGYEAVTDRSALAKLRRARVAQG